MAHGIRHVPEQYKPCAAMMATQCIFAAMTLWVKAAFGRGMSPMVVVVYWQAIATVVLAPIAVTANNRTKLKEKRPGTRGFFLVFVAALIGATVNQNLCYQGLHLGSSSLATTMTNMIPAITFAMALAVNGRRFLNSSLGDASMLLHTLVSEWVIGAMLLIVSSSCWSPWLILQGPICKSYMDPLTLSAWTCFFSTLQSAAVAFFLLPDQSAWRIHSVLELSCYIFAGVFGSGVNFYLQSWCISVRGALYSAMFTPLCTVLATVLLHEELHVGSVIGAGPSRSSLACTSCCGEKQRTRGRPPRRRRTFSSLIPRTLSPHLWSPRRKTLTRRDQTNRLSDRITEESFPMATDVFARHVT